MSTQDNSEQRPSVAPEYIPQPPQPQQPAQQAAWQPGPQPLSTPQWGQRVIPAAPKSSDGMRIVAVVCALLALLGVGGAITFGMLYADERATAADRADMLQQMLSDTSADMKREQAALAAACDFATVVSNYEPATMDKYFTDVLAATTGAFHESFSGTTAALKETITTVQSRSTLVEKSCGLQSLGDDAAQAVVIIVQQRTNTVQPQPDKFTLAVVMTLAEQPDGRWLVSAMDSPSLN